MELLISKTLLKPEEFENVGFSFSCGPKTFWKRSFSKTFFQPEEFENTNPKWPAIVVFLNSVNTSGVLWTENIRCVFRVELSFSNFSGEVWKVYFAGYEINGHAWKFTAMMMVLIWTEGCSSCLLRRLTNGSFWAVKGRELTLGAKLRDCCNSVALPSVLQLVYGSVSITK